MTEMKIKEHLAKGNEPILYLKMSDSREKTIKLRLAIPSAMTSEFGTIMRNGNLLFTIDCYRW